MMGVPYASVSVLVAAAFLFGVVSSAIRFVNSGGKPSHAVAMLFFGALAITSGWVARIAVTGPSFP